MKARAEEKRKAGAPEEEVPPTELQLLAEIRDLLAKPGADTTRPN
jgi:large conductance mechanosensitive channel